MTQSNPVPNPAPMFQDQAKADSGPGEVDISQSMLGLFSTPVVNHRWRDVDQLNADLAQHIRRLAADGPRLSKSNVGGYHSDLDFFQSDAEAPQALRQRLQRFVVELTRAVLRPGSPDRKFRFDLHGWCNLMRRGDYHGVHCHPNSFWSGVYYVTGNEPVEGHPLSGKLELLDPRPAAGALDASETNLYGRCLFSPVAGQMLVFPAWLQHCVHPYQGAGERITVAFNVGFGITR